MREFPFVNTTGATIPAGAALRITGTNAAGFATVAQANADSSLFVVFSATVDVANGGYGVAFGWDGGVVPVAVLAADEPYTTADTFGTKAGDWRLRKGYRGFRLPTPSVQGIANAVPDPAAVSAAAGDEVDGGFVRNFINLGLVPIFPTVVLTGGQSMSSVAFPQVADTFSLPLGGMAAAGRLVVLVTPSVAFHATAPAAAVPAGQRGFFTSNVISVSVSGATLVSGGTAVLLGVAPWGAPDAPTLLTGNLPFPILLSVVPGTTSVGITVNYGFFYLSESPYVGTPPSIRYSVCTGAAAVGGTATLPLLTRGVTPSPACPSLVSLDAAGALPLQYCMNGTTPLTLSGARIWTSGGGYELTVAGSTNDSWTLTNIYGPSSDTITGWDGTGSQTFFGGTVTIAAGACGA